MQACDRYREVAGSVEARDKSPAAFFTDARWIKHTAEKGSDRTVAVAANTLMIDAGDLAAPYPLTAPAGPELSALTVAEQGLLRACSAAGY